MPMCSYEVIISDVLVFLYYLKLTNWMCLYTDCSMFILFLKMAAAFVPLSQPPLDVVS